MKNVNAKLEERIISLEKSQAKSKQYSRLNNIELSGTPKDIPEHNLEKIVIFEKLKICHDSDLEIEPKEIEWCHRLPASRYIRDSNKRIIVKLINIKYPEAMLRNRKSINNKDFSIWMFMVRFLFMFLFALNTGIFGVRAKTCKGKYFALAVL